MAWHGARRVLLARPFLVLCDTRSMAEPPEHNPNPTGKNQHGVRRKPASLAMAPMADQISQIVKETDARLAEALREYHRQKIDSNVKIAQLLRAEHGIIMR